MKQTPPPKAKTKKDEQRTTNSVASPLLTKILHWQTQANQQLRRKKKTYISIILPKFSSSRPIPLSKRIPGQEELKPEQKSPLPLPKFRERLNF